MKWAYDYADWWIEYKIEQWVDLDGEQEDLLQEGLDPFFKWHRSKIMPRVTDSVSALIAAAQKGKCAERFGQQQALWNDLYKETIEKITPVIGGVMVTLSEDQVEELRVGLEEDFKKAQEKAAERAKQSGKFVDRMDSMLGDLSEEQRTILTQPDPGLEKHSQGSLACRLDHHKKLVESLKGEKEISKVESVLNGWWTQSGCGKAFTDSRASLRARWRARMENLEATLSSEQRASMIEELESLRTNLTGIIQ